MLWDKKPLRFGLAHEVKQILGANVGGATYIRSSTNHEIIDYLTPLNTIFTVELEVLVAVAFNEP